MGRPDDGRGRHTVRGVSHTHILRETYTHADSSMSQGAVPPRASHTHACTRSSFPSLPHRELGVQLTRCQVHHGGSAGRDGIYLGVDLML